MTVFSVKSLSKALSAAVDADIHSAAVAFLAADVRAAKLTAPPPPPYAYLEELRYVRRLCALTLTSSL